MRTSTPFEAFKSFVEFYPKLGATIAFGTMAAAARMIPTSGAAISDAPEQKVRSLSRSRTFQVLGSEVLPNNQVLGSVVPTKHRAKPPSERQAAGRPPNSAPRLLVRSPVNRNAGRGVSRLKRANVLACGDAR